MLLRKLAIKQRVFVLQLLTIAAMFSLDSVLWYQEQEITHFDSVKVLLKDLQIDVLTLRRHEKDFLTRLDLQYNQKHQLTYTRTLNNLMELSNHLLHLDELPNKNVTPLIEEIKRYKGEFDNFVNLNIQLGLTDSTGLRYKIINSLNAVKELGLNDRELDLVTQQQVYESKYLITPSEANKQIIVEHLELLTTTLPTFAQPQLTVHKNAVSSLIEVRTKIGINHNSGSEGEMRRTIHSVENRLSLLLNELQPALTKAIDQTSQMISYFVWLVGITTVLLVYLIGRSITTPINFIVRSIEQLRQGKRDIKFEAENDELGTVISRLQQLQKQLKAIDQLRANELQYQQQLVEEKDKLEQALDELSKMQDQLVQNEKLASLGSLVAGVAHEINTPLGIAVTMGSTTEQNLKGFIEKLESGQMRMSDLDTFKQDTYESLQVLLPALNKASSLIHSFKQVAIDQTSEERRIFNLLEMVDELLQTLTHQLKHTEVRYQCLIDKDIELNSYPGPLGQVITNLFNNAVIHGFSDKQSGEITLAAKQDQDTLILTLQDNGDGIDKHHLNKIFDPFFTTKLGQGGSGLGLNIIYNIVVSLLGGTIEVDSHLQIGTTFVIRIPLTAPVEGDNND